MLNKAVLKVNIGLILNPTLIGEENYFINMVNLSCIISVFHDLRHDDLLKEYTGLDKYNIKGICNHLATVSALWHHESFITASRKHS